MCHIPVLTAWIFFDGNLGFTASHLPTTIWRKSFVLMERREEQEQVREQTGWLIFNFTTSRCVLFRKLWFGGNI